MVRKNSGFWHDLLFSISPSYRNKVIRESRERHEREDQEELVHAKEVKTANARVYAKRISAYAGETPSSLYSTRKGKITSDLRFKPLRGDDVYTETREDSDVDIDGRAVDRLVDELGDVITSGSSSQREQAYHEATRLLRGAEASYVDGGRGSSGRALLRQAYNDLSRKYKRATGQSEGNGRGLESSLAVLAILGGIFCLSPNLTGNVIAEIPIKTTSIIGAGLIIIGLIASLFYIRAKKK